MSFLSSMLNSDKDILSGNFAGAFGGGNGGSNSGDPTALPSYPVDANQLSQAFQSTLGRAPTQAEIEMMAPYIQNGSMSYQQVAQYLQSTPEALQNRQTGQQAAYAGALTAGNNQILGQAADAANASYAQNGRQFSSGQGNSVLQAGQQLAAQQSPLLAGNLQGQQAALNNAYNTQGQNAWQNANNLTNSDTSYARQMALNSQNQNNYQNLMRQQATQGLQSQLLGAGLSIGGMALGGPIGGMAGGALGNMFSGGGSSMGTGYGPGTNYSSYSALGPSWNG